MATLKTSTILLICLLSSLYIVSQQAPFTVQPKYLKKTNKTQLEKATHLSDLISDFPHAWISSSDYISTEIISTNLNLTERAEGINNELSTEQHALLVNANTGAEIKINVKYNHKNPITHQLDKKELSYSTTFLPETEAHFSGGIEKLQSYLDQKELNDISPSISEESSPTTIIEFTVSSEGDVRNIKVIQPSIDSKIDQKLINLLERMPRWVPASDMDGQPVYQVFELRYGNLNGC